MNRHRKTLLAGTVLVLCWTACDLPHEPGPQPTSIVDTDFEAALNIMGVLRMDDRGGSSFIHVERAYQIEETDTVGWEEYFVPIVSDADVSVKPADDTKTYVLTFEEDSIRGGIYTNHDFMPLEEEQYSLTIRAPDLPELTATTLVPVKPSIDSTSLVVSKRSISFDLVTTVETGLYDVYIISQNDTLHQRMVSQYEGKISVQFNLPSDGGQPRWIEIYGYDSNLTEYLTASITIKPQTYQETVTTVTGGFGCFGSLSRAVIDLK